jgi:hypothetical protein
VTMLVKWYVPKGGKRAGSHDRSLMVNIAGQSMTAAQISGVTVNIYMTNEALGFKQGACHGI